MQGVGFVGAFAANVYFWVGSVLIAPSSNTLTASKGGVDIIVNGNGFDNSNNDLTVLVGTVKCLISTFTATQISCQSPRFSTASN